MIVIHTIPYAKILKNSQNVKILIQSKYPHTQKNLFNVFKILIPRNEIIFQMLFIVNPWNENKIIPSIKSEINFSQGSKLL